MNRIMFIILLINNISPDILSWLRQPLGSTHTLSPADFPSFHNAHNWYFPPCKLVLAVSCVLSIDLLEQKCEKLEKHMFSFENIKTEDGNDGSTCI